ncbi:MAG: hypothetical protein ACOYOH_26600, partial [Paracraurococcus sp.]
VQSVEPSPTLTQVPPGTLALMPRPIVGIERVGNGSALLQRQQPETDADLRARARRAVRHAQGGTLAGLETAVRACGIADVKVLEDPVLAPAEVTVVIGDPEVADDVLEQVHASIRDARPAGVRVAVNRASAIHVRVAAVLDLARPAGEAEQAQILQRLRSDLRTYIAQLTVGVPLRGAKLRSVLTADDRIVAAGPAPGRPLVDPYVAGISVAGRLRTPDDDIMAAATQRVVLDTTGDWPILVLRPPGLRVDAEITLLAGQVTARAAVGGDAAHALEALLARKVGELDHAAQRRAAGLTVATTTIDFGELSAAVAGPAVDPTGLRFTVVHERDGRVAILARANERDVLEPGEVPRLGGVTVRPGETEGR